MSQPLIPYVLDKTHPAVHNPLLEAPPEGVPAVDELEATLAELGVMRTTAHERSKKAAGDLKVIENEMRRMREREKGKGKAGVAGGVAGALEKGRVKREQSYTPLLDKERSFSPTLPSASAAGTSAAPSRNASPIIAHKVPPDIRKLKKKEKDKKRKRDEDSDADLEPQRPRKESPHPIPTHKDHTHKSSKLNNVAYSKPIPPDWSLPASHSLLPQRPVFIPSLPAGPRKPIEVKEDFSKAKAPANQVPITTFYSSIDPWIRNIREEDVGWLEYDGDTIGPYVVPELGKHYSEQWEEEDVAFYGGVPAALDFSSRNHAVASSSHSFSPQDPLPKWDATTLSDGDLASERGLGPVSERLVSALLPIANPATWKAVKDAEDLYEANVASNGNAESVVGGSGERPALPREKIIVADFEERLKESMRFHGLLQGEPNFKDVVDDPISIALRQAQRQLRVVSATNKARRSRLAIIARDRLTYQEYVDVREGLDKSITNVYSKLQKKEGPKASKKKKKGDNRGERDREREASAGLNGMNGLPNGTPISGPGTGSSSTPAPVALPNPASLGLGPDEDNTLAVPEALKKLVETRREWEDVVGRSIEQNERETPGRYRGLPVRSVYEGVEEEVREMLGASRVLIPAASKNESAKGEGEKG